MTARTVSAALLFALAAVPVAACTIEKAPAQSPPPAAPTAAAPTSTVPTLAAVPCPPVGVWKVAGPAGAQEVKVTDAGNGKFNVWYNGTQANGQVSGNKMDVDMGAASGGLYSCNLAQDCKTMSCGFTGQQPQVFTKQ